MREGLIIVPQKDNDGVSLQSVCDSAAEYIMDQFGGVTITEGKGAWKDAAGKVYRDPVWLLTTAYEGSSANDATLWNAAEYIRTAGKQEAVYIRYSTGLVEFVDGKHKQSIAA